MKIYEITFITKEEPGDLVKKTIEEFDGKVLDENKIGQKQFAYPIEKENKGFYTTYYFEIEPAKVNDFSRKLTLNDEIMRHLIVLPVNYGNTEKVEKVETQKNEKVEEKEEVEEVKAEIEEPKIEEVVSQDKEIEVPEQSEPAVEEEKKEEKKKPAKAKKAVVKEEKVEESDEEERQKALDKKLDELLKD